MAAANIIGGLLQFNSNRPSLQQDQKLIIELFPDSIEVDQRRENLYNQIKKLLGNNASLINAYDDTVCEVHGNNLDITYFHGLKDGLELAILFQKLGGNSNASSV